MCSFIHSCIHPLKHCSLFKKPSAYLSESETQVNSPKVCKSHSTIIGDKGSSKDRLSFLGIGLANSANKEGKMWIHLQ